VVEEREVGGMRWLMASGPGVQVFGELGELARDQIHAIATDDEAAHLHRHARAHPELFASVVEASRAAYPRAWAELAAMADGAGLPVEDLALLNCRGDLGMVTSRGAGDGAENCSDLAWRRSLSFIAHNEDEPVSYLGKCALLTLHLDDEQPVTAYWVPGFLPANAFSLNGGGLVISADHVPVPAPARAPGRAFVARELQRAATDVAGAAEFLDTNPSAGGFSYTIGDRTGRIIIAEAAGGRCVRAEVGDREPIAWHTNHGRLNDAAAANAHGTSLKRGEILAALQAPVNEEPDYDWFLDALTSVRADPDGVREAATLCTFVAELTTGQIVVRDRDASPEHHSFVDFLAGPPLT
jgi:hypothetical protein